MIKDPSETRRRYHSPRRQEQAQRTRESILAAARRLFGTRGYTATTLPAIAREAGVSAPTITAVFGTKAALLEALINEVLGGDAASSPAEDRPWWREMLAEPDPVTQIRLLVASGRRVQERGADVYGIVRGAATADPEFAAIMERRQGLLWADMLRFAESLAARGALAPGVSAERAADLLWALAGPETYRLFVIDRGWDSDAYERWVASTLVYSLLGRSEQPGTDAAGLPS